MNILLGNYTKLWHLFRVQLSEFLVSFGENLGLVNSVSSRI